MGVKTGQGKEVVAQPIEVAYDEGVHVNGACQGYGFALGPPADGSGNVAIGCCAVTAGQNKVFELGEVRFHAIHFLLELVYIFLFDLGHGKTRVSFGGQLGTYGEEGMLDIEKFRMGALVVGYIADQTHEGIELVDGSVGIDAEVVLAYTGAAQQGSFSGVAFTGIYFHNEKGLCRLAPAF